MTHPIPDDALDADIAILAKKGAGKTYTAKGIVERLLDDGARVLVLDPLSTWWGLKSSADGESAGYPIAVFGGPHGDMPLTESMARPLAEIISRENLPAVMDIAFMKKAEQQRFTCDLLEELFAKNRDPLWLVLEEAHVFAPQSPTGVEASAFHEVDRIARMGRSFGFRLISITQRSSRLHKDVLTQAATMVALRIQHQLDQKPILDWFTANADGDFAKTVKANLANLDVGEAFVGATDQDFFDRVKFPRITTLDSSATPKRGEKRVEPKTLAEVDLSAVREALDAPVEEPSAKTKIVKVVDEAAIEKARQDGYAAGERAAWEAAIQALHQAKVDEVRAAPKPEPEISRKAKPRKTEGENPLVAAARRIWPAKLTWAALCTMDGRKARGGHFNSLKRSALDLGQLREENGLVVLAEPPETGGECPADLLEQNLPEPARSIFKEIRRVPGFNWTYYAEKLGKQPRGGHWN
ncbi:MAG: helicase HerA-like domain-containing protein, partial [Pseudomonadota bacterium]